MEMKRTFRAFSALLMAAVAFTTACSDGSAPSEPVAATTTVQAPSANPSLIGAVLDSVGTALEDLKLVTVLGRKEELPNDVSVSARIGRGGGRLDMPALGLSVIVPEGAVTDPVTFKVTAIAGRAVAYEFEPHGMTFRKQLILRQDLRKTTWMPLVPLQGQYFKDRAQVDPFGLKALINETISSVLSIRGARLELRVKHFSGYLVSCG